MRISVCIAGLSVIGLLAVGCKKAPPADVAATVNGRPITYADVDKHFQLQFSDAKNRPADDQMSIQKLEILRSLIDNEIMLQRAEKLSLMATDADVDSKFNELKAPYTQEEFQKQLKARNMTAEDLRAQVRRDQSVQKLFNREITSHIAISDKEIGDFYAANKESFNLPEPQIQLAQIVVTATADQSVRNLKNDNAMNEEQARTKVQALEARIRQGEDFAMLAQNFSEDPETAPNGGVVGYVGQSNIERADPVTRNILLSLQPGQVSQPLKVADGYRIVKVLAREPAGQRELNDPVVQQRIRETLLNRKDQLLRTAYYEVARNEAEVLNQYARSIVDNKSTK